MRHRKKRAGKDGKSAENTPNQGISEKSNRMTKNITKENGNATNGDKGKLESNLPKDLSMTNDTSTLNGAANKEEFHLINGHEIPKAYMRVRQQSIVAAQQLSVDLAQNCHTFLRYGTYATLVIAFLLVFPYYFSIILRPNLSPVMDGIVAPGFEKVAETFK